MGAPSVMAAPPVPVHSIVQAPTHSVMMAPQVMAAAPTLFKAPEHIMVRHPPSNLLAGGHLVHEREVSYSELVQTGYLVTHHAERVHIPEVHHQVVDEPPKVVQTVVAPPVVATAAPVMMAPPTVMAAPPVTHVVEQHHVTGGAVYAVPGHSHGMEPMPAMEPLA